MSLLASTRFAIAALVSAGNFAAHAADEPAPAPPSKVSALVSVVGDRLSFARQKKSTGTSVEPMERASAKVSDPMAIDGAVLRGVDRILGRAEPDVQRIFLKVHVPELQTVEPQRRNEASLAAVIAQLQPIAQRQQWDRIYVVTPDYRYSELPGLGSKLHGVGIYVQPLSSERLEDVLQATASSASEFETVNEDGKPNVRGSDVYITLYFVTRIHVLDAKTLKVIESRPHIYHQKIYDFNWTAIDLMQAMPPEKFAARMEQFVERASSASMIDTLGSGAVSAGELKVEPNKKR